MRSGQGVKLIVLRPNLNLALADPVFLQDQIGYVSVAQQTAGIDLDCFVFVSVLLKEQKPALVRAVVWRATPHVIGDQNIRKQHFRSFV